MKKIFYFLASAIVALGAMACQNEVDENITPGTQNDVVSFTVAFDEATRISMTPVGNNTANFDFVNGDKLYVQPNEGDYFGNTYKFSTEDGETFSCQNANLVSELETSGNYAMINSRENGEICSELGVDGFLFYGYADLTTKEPVVLEMQHTVFHFTVPEGTEATLKHTDDIFVTEGGEWVNEMTFTKGEYWVAAWASIGGTLSYSINGEEAKSITRDFEDGTIYNLGELSKTIYLVPDMWAAAGAWFAAHFFNAKAEVADVKMTDNNADGIYECNVPVGMESVTFCRMNPAYNEFSWDNGHVWDQSENLTINEAPNNYYYITDWQAGEWNVKGYDPKASTPGEASPWSLASDWDGDVTTEWSDKDMVTTEIKNIFVVKDVTLDAYASFKVRKDKAWTENYGGGILYMNPNGYIQVYSNGTNISITEAGTYDVYFNYTNKLLYLVDAGTDYTTVAEQTTNGAEPPVVEPEVTENVLYLQPNANWKEAGARFAAYFFNNSENVWVGMTASDSDGIYEVHIPEGEWSNVIFCRMNPGTATNDWNNKWNQTADLTIPTDDKNLYTVAEGAWDKGGGTWSVKE